MTEIFIFRGFTSQHLDSSSDLSPKLAPPSTAILERQWRGLVSFEPLDDKTSLLSSHRKRWTWTKYLHLPVTQLIGMCNYWCINVFIYKPYLLGKRPYHVKVSFTWEIICLLLHIQNTATGSYVDLAYKLAVILMQLAFIPHWLK